ncbi:MAG: hypothetical protein QOG91_502 [Candidatus Parcubacteria bacterium]|jgi:type II secretory pathway pseudopilin PulG|nr:hypothetical protein [Candidatus Parcubacteria bacterium]
MIYSRINHSSRTNNRGFTLVEVLVYLAGVILIIGVIVSMLYYTFRWYEVVAAPSRANQVGIALANRLQNDIRAGQIVNGSGTVYDAFNGSLSLTVFTTPTVTVNRAYALSGGRVTFREASGPVQFLSPADVTVTELYFSRATSTVSTAIRFTIGIIYALRTSTTSAMASSTYSGLAIMRNTYQ